MPRHIEAARHFRSRSLAALVLVAFSAGASAEGISQPGQLASGSPQTYSALAAEPAALQPAPNASIAVVPDRPSPTTNRLWLASVGALVSGTSLDAATSWGHREANGLLASSNGNFGAKGLALKLGSTSGIVIPQIFLRHRAKLVKTFAITNTAMAGMYAGVAVHNIGVTSH